jgi:hypothetical protein
MTVGTAPTWIVMRSKIRRIKTGDLNIKPCLRRNVIRSVSLGGGDLFKRQYHAG